MTLKQGMVFGALLEFTFLPLVGETSLPLWMVCVFGWLPWGIFVAYGVAFPLWVFVRLPLWRGRVRRAAYSVCSFFSFGAGVGAMLVSAVD
jgi:hypothetical protein